jgi:hypothetical protein
MFGLMCRNSRDIAKALAKAGLPPDTHDGIDFSKTAFPPWSFCDFDPVTGTSFLWEEANRLDFVLKNIDYT